MSKFSVNEVRIKNLAALPPFKTFFGDKIAVLTRSTLNAAVVLLVSGEVVPQGVV